MPADRHLTAFVEGLGPGQVVGRQVLGSPCLGDIQVGISLKRNSVLEIEVIRARNLTVKPISKLYPGKHLMNYDLFSTLIRWRPGYFWTYC